MTTLYGAREWIQARTHAERYGQQAGGTHPTGMRSCLVGRKLTVVPKVYLSELLLITTVEPFQGYSRDLMDRGSVC